MINANGNGSGQGDDNGRGLKVGQSEIDADEPRPVGDRHPGHGAFVALFDFQNLLAGARSSYSHLSRAGSPTSPS